VYDQLDFVGICIAQENPSNHALRDCFIPYITHRRGTFKSRKNFHIFFF
jgi:hypothetical protein